VLRLATKKANEGENFMNWVRTLVFSLSVFSVILSTGAFASNVDRASEFLSDLMKLSENVKNNGDQAERIKVIQKLSSSVDFEGLARKSLGKHWTNTSKAKRDEFLVVLKDLVEKVLYPRAKRINSKIGEIKFSEVAGSPSNVKATTKYEYEKAGDLVSRNVEIELVYKIIGKNPRIVDAILEGEQVSTNLNRQFSQILEKRTIDEVLEKMKQKLKAQSDLGLGTSNTKDQNSAGKPKGS
jgi:phospholipid transport system substrate-binding protein